MLSPLRLQRGFSLLELVVVVAIIAFLTAAGLPLITDAIRDSRIRSTGESIIAGLRVSQSEALKRNSTFRFQLVTGLNSSCTLSATGPAWVSSAESTVGKCDISDLETSPMPVRREGGDVSADVSVLAGGNGAFCFNGIGRPLTGTGCNSSLSEIIDIKSSGTACKADGGTARCLRVVITSTGTIRMCDPAVGAAGDPRIC